MKNKKPIIIVTFLLFIGITGLQAQETVTASGGNTTGNGEIISYSVGQIFYTTNKGNDGMVTQGVQQPFEISVISGIEETQGINLNCSAYPNPTHDFLMLKIESSYNADLSGLVFFIYDMNGQLQKSKKITDNETTIALKDFIPATYFLKVTHKNQDIILFKIVKR